MNGASASTRTQLRTPSLVADPQETLTAVFESLPYGVLLVGADGHIRKANRRGWQWMQNEDADNHLQRLLSCAELRSRYGSQIFERQNSLRAFRLEPGAGGYLVVITAGLPAPPEWRLTKRENEVFQLVVQGAVSKEVSAALKCSTRTVERHISSILGKSGYSDCKALMARYI